MIVEVRRQARHTGAEVYTSTATGKKNIDLERKIAISECSCDQGRATLRKCGSDLKVELLKGTLVCAISCLCNGGIIWVFFAKHS